MNALDVILNLDELALLALTAFIVPLKMRPRWVWYFIYTFAAGILWLAFSMAATIWWPEPGIGTLIIGFLSWIVGSVIYARRIMKRPEHK